MIAHRVPRWLIVAFVAMPALFAVDVVQNATQANEREFLLDKSEMTRDHKEVAEFHRLLVAMDDALQKNAVERYGSLNRRLQTVMERELEQARQKAIDAGRAAPVVMGADMIDPFGGMSDGPSLSPVQETAIQKRAQEMEKLLEKSDALSYGLNRGDSGACTRNAAILDRFFKLMRDDLAEVEADIAGQVR